MASHYYNEIDPYCAQWLQNLMNAGMIPHGDIDTRSIEDVRPDDLRGYVQCHFFAGLGGWPLALALAGWPSSRPVWTGSCPCQPFSAAGKGLGFADERHLWPSWQHLIGQRLPPVIFGEQVASATEWLGLVCGDLEASGYAVGHCPIEAASAGADHLRDRIWFVAHAHGFASQQRSEIDGRCNQGSHAQPRAGSCGSDSGGVMANTNQLGTSEERQQRSRQLGGTGSNSGTRGGWIIGHDGKARRVEPGIRLLAHGVSGRLALVRSRLEGNAEIQETHWYSRLGALKALGNAIDPRPAAAFIQSYMEARGIVQIQEVA